MSHPRHQWLIYAIASGACAAINGTFAKLTTTSLTTTLAASLATHLSLPPSAAQPFEYALRAAFFGLNLAFDALMWGLFTRALTLAASTVHVSVLNTSTNFLVAAAAGWGVFGERLPGLWWVGAGMLVAGCLLIGGREGGEGKGVVDEGEADWVPMRGEGEEEPDQTLPLREGARARSPYRDAEDEEGTEGGER